MNILLVDDEPVVTRQMALAMNWTALGIDEVFTALDGEQARAILEAQAVDILVSDIRMPGQSGIELARWARERNPALRSVLLTGYGEFAYAQQAIDARVSKYLTKPTSYPVMAQVLTELIEEIRRDEQLVASALSGALERYVSCEEGEQQEVLRAYAPLFAHLRFPKALLFLEDEQQAPVGALTFRGPERQLLALVPPESADWGGIPLRSLEQLREPLWAERQSISGRMCALMEQDAGVTLGELAEALGKHPNYLSQVFKKERGISFSKYCEQMRLERARQLLSAPQAKVSEVARRLGYSSVSYFNYAFKKAMGMPPSAYQRRVPRE